MKQQPQFHILFPINANCNANSLAENAKEGKELGDVESRKYHPQALTVALSEKGALQTGRYWRKTV